MKNGIENFEFGKMVVFLAISVRSYQSRRPACKQNNSQKFRKRDIFVIMSTFVNKIVKRRGNILDWAKMSSFVKTEKCPPFHRCVVFEVSRY